ncbi:Lrp/AsnC family transcriptional regulator [Pseudarthrobacter sp. CC12]|uniref:Lrp/AsnC family transcriptional regulator n=1 Tax=Pseudarthrobacter sp. CC12 TaxID=3029193 RepID=UPI0032634E91
MLHPPPATPHTPVCRNPKQGTTPRGRTLIPTEAIPPAELSPDQTDFLILGFLEEEGRLSTTILAQRTGISATECTERIQRLERTGHIAGYAAVRSYPDPAARPITALIKIVQQPGRNGHDLLRSMESVPEITNAELLEADRSIMIRVQASSHERLEKIITFFKVQSSVLSLEASTTQTLFNYRPMPRSIRY